MGVQYELVNQTKKERITYAHLDGSKARELAGNPCQAAITAWYLLQNQGDEIQFVSDAYGEWPFRSEKDINCGEYPDKTDEVVEQLIEKGILKDIVYSFQDDDEPDSVYVRNIINVWMSGVLTPVGDSKNP